jgi:hypothetical protein
MNIFDLLFILLFLGSVVAAAAILILALTRHRGSATKLLLTLAAVWSVYLVVLFAADALATQQVTRFGDNQCFDEMCFAVVNSQIESEPASSPISAAHDGRIYVVTVRMTTESRGRPQSEGGLRGRLYQDGRYFAVSDEEHHKYEAAHGASPKLTQRLNPGESMSSVLVFKVPGDIAKPALTLDHGFTPGYFVIGESPFFHKPPILQLNADQH